MVLLKAEGFEIASPATPACMAVLKDRDVIRDPVKGRDEVLESVTGYGAGSRNGRKSEEKNRNEKR